MRQYIDPRVLFCLNGIGVRIAQRLGLHRDAAPFGVSPFEVEMRRRLWWQLVIFDRRLGEVTGSTITALKSTPSDCRLPLNINDADLFVGATEPPTPSNGPSEMIFALTRLELGRMVGPDIVPTPLPTAAAPPKNQPPKAHYMHNKAPQRGSESTPNPDTIRMSATFNFEPKIGEGIAATAKHLDETYLRSLDPKIPLHLFTLNMARSSLAKMRVIQYLCSGVPPSRQQAKDDPSAAVAATGPPTPPNQSASPSPATATRFSSYVLQRAATLTPAERESLVLDSIEMIEADNELHSTPSVKGFMWYAHMYFPFPAYMFLVHELRRTPTGPLADRAWRALVVSHEQRRAADMMAGGAGKGTGHAADATVGKFLRSAMHVALGAMFVKAWDAREAAETARLGPGRGPEAPRFITLLRRRLAELSRGGPAVPPDERNPFRQRLASLIPDVMGKASKSMAATAPGDVVVNNTTPVPGSAKADMFRIVSRTGRLAADDDGGDGDGHLTSSAALSVAGSLTPASSFVPPPLSEAGSTTITNNNSGASSIATPSSALAEGLAAPTESAAGSFNAGYHSMPNPAPAGVDASNDNLSPLNRFFASGSGNGSGMLFGASAMMPSVDFGDMEMDWSQFVQGYADGTAAAGFGWSDFAGVGGDDVIMNGSDWFGSGIP